MGISVHVVGKALLYRVRVRERKSEHGHSYRYRVVRVRVHVSLVERGNMCEMERSKCGRT